VDICYGTVVFRGARWERKELGFEHAVNASHYDPSYIGPGQEADPETANIPSDIVDEIHTS